MLLRAEDVVGGLDTGDCAKRPSPRSAVWIVMGRGGGSRLVRPDEMLSKNEFMKATKVKPPQSQSEVQKQSG